MENAIDPVKSASASADQLAFKAGKFPSRLWWPSFVVLVVVGFLVVGIGYRHGLPYVDDPDEMTIWTMGRATIDPTWTFFQPEYPPGVLVVNSIVQRTQILLGDPYIDVARTVEIMRFLSVLAFTVTLALVMIMAWRLAGPSAGLLSGVFWILLPVATALAKIATIDAWLSMWFIASVLTAFEGWHRKSLKWIVASLILAIIATVFKWQGAAALGMAGLACLSLWNTNKRRMVVAIAVYAVIVAVFSYWTIFIHKALEGDAYLPGTHTSVPTIGTVLINLQTQMSSVGPFLIFGLLPLLALALSWLIPSVRNRLNIQWPLWTLPILLIAFNMILSFNGAPVFDRHYVAGYTVLSVLAAIGVVLLAQLAERLAHTIKLPPVGYVLMAALLVVIIVTLVPAVNATYAMDTEMIRPDTRAYFAEWARTTATAGPLLITNPKVAVAVQTLYGYRGRPIDTPYNQGSSVYFSESQITQQLIDAKGIKYIVAASNYDPKNLTTPLTRLIGFDNDPSMRGDAWTAYYVGALPVYPPDKRITFGNEVELRGMSLSKLTACPGDTLDLQMVWGADTRPTRLYSTYVHLYSTQTKEIATTAGGIPVSDDRPTVTWDRPDELLVGPTQTVSLAIDSPPGDYQLWLGVFDPVAGTRLKLPDGSDHAVLTDLTVKSCVP